MSNYSYEFKLKVVKDYLDGGGSYRVVSKKHGIPGSSQIQDWVNAYRHFGEDGLLPQRGKNYTVQFKRNAVELYLTKQMTSQEVAFELGMTSSAQLRGWVSDFRSRGLAGLSGTKGTQPVVNNKKKKKDASSDPVDKERIKELEIQVRALQIQNAYLKELRSLRNKRKQCQPKKKPESSTDSAKHSN